MNGDDSNMLILPEHKKRKKKHENQMTTKLRQSTPKLSSSHRRKLKRIEEEKEKAVLFSESIEMLEKYKIQEDLYSLLWSSRKLGQVETAQEKRRREVQLAKKGLILPQFDQSLKRRAGKSSYNEIEHNLDERQSSQLCNGTAYLQPCMIEKGLSRTATFPSESSWERSPCRKNEATMTFTALEESESHKELSIDGVMPSVLECPPSSLTISNVASRCMEISMVGVNKSPILTNSSASTPADCQPQITLNTPTVVHVLRPKEVKETRRDLPIVMMEQEIMEAINENPCVIVCGETGCGKTTQVPQFLFEGGFGSKDCASRRGMIGVTQPRRVAVLATAKRVAYELGLCLGKEVGFQVRYNKRVGDNCSIKFMTDGILLRELQSDFLLKQYSTIILDEAHERSLNTDILIGMLSRVIQARQKIYEEQKTVELSGVGVSPEKKIFPLRLVLMSATLRVEDFLSGRRIFHNPPPVIEVPTRQFPVTIHFSKRTEIVDYIGQAYKKIMSIHKRLPSGGILVFVTGQREVEFLCQKLRKASKHIVASKSKRNDELVSGTEGNISQELDLNEIDEAFEIQGNSSRHQTDRFSSYDEDDTGDLSEDESYVEYNTDEESDGSSSYQETLGSDCNLADVLGDDGDFASLKAAFEALTGKSSSAPISEKNPIIPGKREEENGQFLGPMIVLPLYAMLPASVQLRVFEEGKEGERLVVVATNVAETSLTIPGIKYVVDTGREKVKKYILSNGMETYEVQWISKASAAQRAGRAGRTAPGHCYRLYSSAVFNNTFDDFSSPEITKLPVDGVVLLMKSMGIDKVVNFPFPTSPDATALVEAERCLRVLEALDDEGRLTSLGKAMSNYPMSPRHSRMLLTVIQILKKAMNVARRNLVFGYAVAAVAALSMSNPFVLQYEGSQLGAAESEKCLDNEEKLKKKKLKESARLSRERFSNPTSDSLTVAYALQCFELSQNQAEFCNENALHLKTMEEMSKLRKQILNLVFHQSFSDEFSWSCGTIEDVENAWRMRFDKHPLLLNEEDLLGQAICAGWADRVAKRSRGHLEVSEERRRVNAVRYQSCAVKETVFLHRWSSVLSTAPEFLVYSELLCTTRPYIYGATRVKAEWLAKYAVSLCSFSAPLSDPKPFYEPLSDQIFNYVAPTFGPHLWSLPLHSLPVKDDAHRAAVFAFSLLEGVVLPCVKAFQEFLAESPAIILRPESAGQVRVGNLLYALKNRSRTIHSRAMLRKAWNENPRELYSEILDWFQKGFHYQFDNLWAQMHRQACYDARKHLVKSKKSGKKSSSIKRQDR